MYVPVEPFFLINDLLLYSLVERNNFFCFGIFYAGDKEFGSLLHSTDCEHIIIDFCSHSDSVKVKLASVYGPSDWQQTRKSNRFLEQK